MTTSATPLADAQALVAAFVAAYSLSAPPTARTLDLVAAVGEVAQEILEGSAYGQQPFTPPPTWAGVAGRCALRPPLSGERYRGRARYGAGGGAHQVRRSPRGAAASGR